ncbi:hypothetical protein HMPREF1497_1591 [Fusobacterium sp. CM21]|jgi:hypothetical protein|uniref:hypothetical protein n=1 Tax=Fusobacterium nucleatum TaxID=851 RepID=UPI0003E1FD22|nr:hypothetical protein [Fusobacterium nucleatum]ETS95991.1 hypothetical protein HMPREF1497_1591 [Fusobacterium sp. CM21]OHU81995.1 hypothetical protein BKN39_06600 [Fusobacterium nucleatum]
MNANAKKVYEIIKNQQGIINVGYTTISTVALAKGSGLTTDEIKAAKGELLKEGKLFYNSVEQNIGSVDLETGEIRQSLKQRLYIDKDIFQNDSKEMKKIDMEKLTTNFLKYAERINNIKNLSNEAIAIFSLIETSKKNLAFSSLTTKEMESITGLSNEQIKKAREELTNNKLVFEVGIPLKEPYKYIAKDEKGNDIEKEAKTKTVYITNTEVLSKVIKAVELANEKENVKENSWNKTKGSLGIAD